MPTAQVKPGGTVIGTPLHLVGSGVTTPDTLQQLLIHAVTADKLLIHQVLVSCRTHGKFEIYINTTLIGSGRIGPSASLVPFHYVVPREALNGETVKVELKTLAGSPIVDYEAYIQATTQ